MTMRALRFVLCALVGHLDLVFRERGVFCRYCETYDFLWPDAGGGL